MHPYRVSKRHELQHTDYSARVKYCKWFRTKFGKVVNDMPIIFLAIRRGFGCSDILQTTEFGLLKTRMFTRKVRYILSKLELGVPYQNIE